MDWLELLVSPAHLAIVKIWQGRALGRYCMLTKFAHAPRFETGTVDLSSEGAAYLGRLYQRARMYCTTKKTNIYSRTPMDTGHILYCCTYDLHGAINFPSRYA